MKFGRGNGDRGAAAVEFALVSMLLIMILLGIIEFGRLWMVQSGLSHAAREGAREMAIHNDPAEAQDRIIEASETLTLPSGAVVAAVSVTDCEPGLKVQATASATVSTMSGVNFLWGSDGINLVGKAEMRCGG